MHTGKTEICTVLHYKGLYSIVQVMKVKPQINTPLRAPSNKCRYSIVWVINKGPLEYTSMPEEASIFPIVRNEQLLEIQAFLNQSQFEEDEDEMLHGTVINVLK